MTRSLVRSSGHYSSLIRKRRLHIQILGAVHPDRQLEVTHGTKAEVNLEGASLTTKTFIIFFLVCTMGLGASAQVAPQPATLVPGQPVEREIAGGQMHDYRIALGRGSSCASWSSSED